MRTHPCVTKFGQTWTSCLENFISASLKLDKSGAERPRVTPIMFFKLF